METTSMFVIDMIIEYCDDLQTKLDWYQIWDRKKYRKMVIPLLEEKLAWKRSLERWNHLSLSRVWAYSASGNFADDLLRIIYSDINGEIHYFFFNKHYEVIQIGNHTAGVISTRNIKAYTNRYRTVIKLII